MLKKKNEESAVEKDKMGPSPESMKEIIQKENTIKRGQEKKAWKS